MEMTFLYSEICSPLDQFEIRNLISISGPVVGNVQISLTNIGLYLTIATILVISLNLLSTNYNKIVMNELCSRWGGGPKGLITYLTLLFFKGYPRACYITHSIVSAN